MTTRNRALPPEILAAFLGPDAASAIKEAAAETGPVPYTLTPKAEALLAAAEAGPEPEAGL
jgi:hypothetical protein